MIGRWTPEDEIAHQRLFERLSQMSPAEAFEVAVRAGIYTPDGQLTPEYRGDEPSSVPDQPSTVRDK